MGPSASMPTRRTGGRLVRTGGIWLLTTAVALTALGLFTAVAQGLPAPAVRLDVPWWALLVGFVLTECLVVHVHFRREAHTLSLSELPLVIGLFAVSPLGLVAAQVIGMGSALVLYRRQRPVKIAFNLAQTALCSTLAVIVFRVVVDGRDPFGPLGWSAGLAAAVVAALTGVVLVTGAVSIAERRPQLGRTGLTAAVSLIGTLTATSLALAAVTLAQTRTTSVVLLLLPAGACALAMRAYDLERRRTEHVQSLYDSIRRTEGASELDSGVRQLLRSAKRLLRADYAELILLPHAARSHTLRSTLGPQGETLLEQTELTPAEEAALEGARSGGGILTRARDKRLAFLDPCAADRDLKDLIVATLQGEEDVLGLLLVGDRSSDVSTFGSEDEKLFRTFAGHAALLLENEQLERSLAKLTELEAQLRHQALHDALTGLPNRRLFHTRVEEAFDRAPEGASPVVLFIDLDGFKAINDDLGHAAGDELLTAFAERLRGCVRPEELPARFGGDEFAVLLEDGCEPVALEVAQRLVAAVENPFSIQGRRLTVRLSIGIAAGDDARGVEELLANADFAMYAAKNDDAASYAVYSAAMRRSAEARQKLGRELEEALERDRFAVHYQPIVDLRTGETIAFEALARWRRGSSETVTAAEFMPAAEEGELIARIGQVVLRSACIQTREWRSEPDGSELSVCVNLSAAELASPRLGVDVAAALLESGLEASRLILEITEKTATADLDATLATMNELRRLGVRFALDEYGTGRSSLEQLCELPFDVLKIARPLIARLGTGRPDERVTRAIVNLGKSLGLKVVAEGIESREQASLLEEIGCHLGQGFYFDRALSVPQATRRLLTSAADHLRLVAAE